MLNLRLLYIKINILWKNLNILIERWWFSRPRSKDLIKTIRTLGKGSKVRIVIEKSTIGLGIESKVRIEIVIGKG